MLDIHLHIIHLLHALVTKHLLSTWCIITIFNAYKINKNIIKEVKNYKTSLSSNRSLQMDYYFTITAKFMKNQAFTCTCNKNNLLYAQLKKGEY